LAKRYLSLQAGRGVCLPDWIHRRSFPVHHGAGGIPEPDLGECAGGVSARRGGVWGAQGDADGQRAAVCQLARADGVRAGDGKGSRAPYPQLAASPDDLGKDRTVLEDDLGGVPVPGAVRGFRGGAGTDSLVVEILQPPAAAPGAGGAVSRGPVLCDPEGTARGDGNRDRGQYPGAGAARPSGEAVLHGGADGRPVGDDTSGTRAGANERRGKRKRGGDDL
jgi:hypothetical protein